MIPPTHSSRLRKKDPSVSLEDGFGGVAVETRRPVRWTHAAVEPYIKVTHILAEK